MYIESEDFQIGKMYTAHHTSYILLGGTVIAPELAPINATPLVCRGSRGPSTRCYGYSPEMGLPKYAQGERPPYKLLSCIVLYLDAEVDIDIGDELCLYAPDDEDRYTVTATSEPRPGLRQIFGELADSPPIWHRFPSVKTERVNREDKHQEVQQ